MIVNLTVEDDADAAVRVPHRLHAAGKIDDREPGMTKMNSRLLVGEHPVAVRTAMHQGGRHRCQVDPIANAGKPSNPTHQPSVSKLMNSRTRYADRPCYSK